MMRDARHYERAVRFHDLGLYRAHHAALVAPQEPAFAGSQFRMSELTAAVALARLGALTGEARYTNHADQIIRLLARAIPQSPSAFSQALMAIATRLAGTTEIVITGDRPDLLAEVRRHWLPDAVLAWGEPYGGPLWQDRPAGLAFVCRAHVCQLPARNVTDLASHLR